MQYSEIKAIAVSLPQYFDVVTSELYVNGKHIKTERIELLFTVHGDYCGNTVNKSNYHVLLDRLNNVSNNLGNIKILESYYSTSYLIIIGGIKNELWKVINDALESLENYPLLSDDHYSDQTYDDCYESWISWQYDDISHILSKDHDIDLDDDDYESLDDAGKLLDFLSEHDFFDQIEDTEENSCSYWYIRENNIADIATLITSKFSNCYV